MLAIGPEVPDDALAIAEVHVRTWQRGYAEIMPAEVLARLNVAAWAQRRRDLGTADPDHPFRTLVARTDDETVLGFATVGPYRIDQDPERLDHRYGEILGLFVRPEHWGTGVGRQLLAASVAELAGTGPGADRTELRLWILADNSRARRFYERAGLVPDGERSTYELQRTGGRPPLGLVELRYTARLGELARPPGR